MKKLLYKTYAITDIADRDTGFTSKDPKTRQRIGFIVKPCIANKDEGMVLRYIEDRDGNPKEGHFRTSKVNDIIGNKNKALVITDNSVYALERRCVNFLTKLFRPRPMPSKT